MGAMTTPRGDLAADLRRAGRDHREVVEREERALMLLRRAICAADDADQSPEDIARIHGEVEREHRLGGGTWERYTCTSS